MSGHYYLPDGTPVHEVLCKSTGEMRPTHIGDCRKMSPHPYPSVTTVLGILDKPGLNKWKMGQCILTAKKTRRKKGESDKDYCRRVMAKAFDQVDKAADLGTNIHAALEEATQDRAWDQKLAEYVEPTLDLLREQDLWPSVVEARVVHDGLGYAGTLDGVTRSRHSFLDHKTTKTIPSSTNHDHASQLAAYMVAYIEGRSSLPQDSSTRPSEPEYWMGLTAANIYISTTTPGRVEAHFYTPEELAKGWRRFANALEIWKDDKNYDPVQLNKENNE